MSDDETSDEDRMIKANARLVKDDNTPVTCLQHSVTKRWGDLSSIAQLAILAGLDVIGDRCIMDER